MNRGGVGERVHESGHRQSKMSPKKKTKSREEEKMEEDYHSDEEMHKHPPFSLTTTVRLQDGSSVTLCASDTVIFGDEVRS